MGLSAAEQVFSAEHATKGERSKNEGKVRHFILSSLRESIHRSCSPLVLNMAADKVMSKAFRKHLMSPSMTRTDGRGKNDLRNISSESGFLRLNADHESFISLPDMVHGSSFFCRGDTHVLATCTLGPIVEQRKTSYQLYDTHSAVQNFNLHYDFPPYCTGEVGPQTSNRRMIGHGMLAEVL